MFLTWFIILMSVNLQTSFLTPPFGFTLFYMKGIVPPAITMAHIYRGIVPFVANSPFMSFFLKHDAPAYKQHMNPKGALVAANRRGVVDDDPRRVDPRVARELGERALPQTACQQEQEEEGRQLTDGAGGGVA